jgi:hypothetical protein
LADWSTHGDTRVIAHATTSRGSGLFFDVFFVLVFVVVFVVVVLFLEILGWSSANRAA